MSGHCLLKICKDKRHELSSYTISPDRFVRQSGSKNEGMAIFPVANKRKTLPRGLAPVQGDVAAGEERSLTPREDKGIVMGLIGWDGVLG